MKFVNRAGSRSKRAREAGGVDRTVSYDERDTAPFGPGDPCRIGPGQWARERTGEVPLPGPSSRC
jgi:hypothetical protein